MMRAGDSTVTIDKYIERKRNQLLVDIRNLFLTNIFAMYNEALVAPQITWLQMV